MAILGHSMGMGVANIVRVMILYLAAGGATDTIGQDLNDPVELTYSSYHEKNTREY